MMRYSKAILFMSSLLLLSCSKEIETNSPNVENASIQVEVSNNTLSFTSLSEFNDVLKNIEENEENQISAISATTKASISFKSLYEAKYDEFMSTLSPEDIEMLNAEGLYYEPEDDYIAYPALTKLLNKDHEVIAGDFIYKYVNNGLLVIPINTPESIISEINTTQYDSLQDGETINIGNGISFSRINYSSGTTTIIEENEPETKASATNGSFTLANNVVVPASKINRVKYCDGGGDASDFNKMVANLFGVSVTAYNEYDNKHRMALRVFSQDYLICKTTGMTVRMQQKILGIWFNKKAEEFRYGWLGPLCEYTYTGKISFGTTSAIAMKTPKSSYTKPIVLFSVNLADLKTLSVTNQDIEKMLYNGLQKNSSTINKVLNNKSYSDSPKGLFALDNTKSNIVYYLFPQRVEQVDKNSGRDAVYWDFDINLGISATFNMSTGALAVAPAIPSVRSIAIKRIFAYAAVKYDGEWRMCIIHC